MTEFADSQLTFVDLAGEAWGSFRLFVGGKDVTDQAQIAGYQLVEPYTYGPADFNLPKVSQFTVDQWGSGDYKWFGEGKPVRLKKVDASGSVVRTVWRGFISRISVTARGTEIHCEGDAMGRLQFRRKLPDLFSLRRPVGRKIYNAFNYCRLDLTPSLGGGIGVDTDGRGFTGTQLDYVDSLLSLTIDTDGSQYTVRAKDAGGYELVEKDTTTVDFTMFLGADGVDVELTSDLAEKPNVIFGSGVDPSGLVWVNGKYPELKQGDPADYPMTDSSSFGVGTTDADTDSGSGVTVMLYKLVGAGYLPRKDKPGGYDDDAAEAVKDLQDDAGLSQTGTMDTDTWNALWDLDVTGTSLQAAFVMPLAQSTKTKRWNYTSNGSRASLNPDFDPTVIPRDLYVDHGTSVEKSRGRRYSRGVLHRAQATKNWAGTATLTADVFAGERTYTDVDLADHVMSRLDIREGMNVMLRNFDGDTLFHVSAANVTVGQDGVIGVQLGLDTQARDAATLAEVIARNIESRVHRARSWKRQHLADVNVRQIEFSEACGLIWNSVSCPADTWTVVKIPAGQAGSVSRVRVQTSSDAAEFAVAITAQRTTAGFWNGHVPNPLSSNTWLSGKVPHLIDRDRALLYAAGTKDQPGGYGPNGQKTAADGTATGDTLTGLLLDDAGFDYHTFDEPVVYLAIYPDRDTVLEPQRVLWDLMQNSAA